MACGNNRSAILPTTRTDVGGPGTFPRITPRDHRGPARPHTIANPISHLVGHGHGKRVLVTSQREQALLILRDKIPSPSAIHQLPC